MVYIYIPLFFFFNDTATTEIYTLSLHDALPILINEYKPEQVIYGHLHGKENFDGGMVGNYDGVEYHLVSCDYLRSESTRLNSSHANISYAVFCLKKKTKKLEYS